MLRPLPVLVLSLCFVCLTAPANEQKIIPYDSPVYEALDAIYLASGFARPSHTRPITVDEARRLLLQIDAATLPMGVRHTYRYVREALQQRFLYREGRGFRFNSGIGLNVETYLHANDQRETWVHGYEERLPLADIPLELWLFDGFYANTTLTLKEEYRAITAELQNYTNIPVTLNYLDWYFPFRAFFSIGGDHWNFQFGRDKVTWGNGHTGNLMLSDFCDFHDFVRFTTYWRSFKFTSVYIVLDSWLKPDELPPTPAPTGWYENYGELYKAFFAHRLDFRLFDRVGLSLTEAVVFGNKYPELRDFNPLMIFHNWFIPERANSLLTVEAEVNPFRWVSLYGQYAIDEFQTAYEIEEGSGGRPGAAGYLFGCDVQLPLWAGFVGVSAEYALTDPWLYNRWHPLTRYTSRRRIWSYIPPDGYEWVDKPLGYGAGPDAEVQSYRLGYKVWGGFELFCEYSMERKGEMHVGSQYELGPAATSLKTPTGVVKTTSVVHGHAEVSPFRFLSVGSDLYYVFIENAGHVAGTTQQDWEWICFMKISL